MWMGGESRGRVLSLSVLIHLYFHLLEELFYSSHRDSLLYTNFSRTHIISIPYSIPTTLYFIPLPSLSLSLTLSLSSCYSVLARPCAAAGNSGGLCSRYVTVCFADARCGRAARYRARAVPFIGCSADSLRLSAPRTVKQALRQV